MRVYSPWTIDEVQRLKKRQEVSDAYTCLDCGEVLVPEEFGLVCPNKYCDFMQNWVEDEDLKKRK